MDLISGVGSVLSLSGSQLKNVKQDGMIGLILKLKKLIGQEKRKKNYYILSRYFQVNGELLLLLLGVGQLINVLSNMRNYLIEHKVKRMMIRFCQMILEI